MPAARRVLALVLLLPLLAAACGETATSPTTTGSAPYAQVDLVTGTGAQVLIGSQVTVAYTGWLYDPSRPENKGNQFDSSSSFPTQIGVGRVIAGWDRGVVGMRVGGKRRLITPPELAYGSAGRPPRIPRDATLVFDIDLLAVQ